MKNVDKYVAMIPSGMGVLILLALVAIGFNYQRHNIQVYKEFNNKAVQQLKALEMNSGDNYTKITNYELWSRLLDHANICKWCPNLQEMVHDKGFNIFPVVVTGYDDHTGLSYTAVVGTVTITNFPGQNGTENAEYAITAVSRKMVFYVNNAYGNLHRYEGLDQAEFLDRNGHWGKLGGGWITERKTVQNYFLQKYDGYDQTGLPK